MTMTRDRTFEDELEIRALVENWAIWRDTGGFDAFLDLWHPDGWMMATWFQASAADFTARARAAFEQGARSMHILGGTGVEIQGDHAVAQTRMQILQRAVVHGEEVDVTCYGRFHDFLQRHEGRWKLVLRQPVYEFDTMAPVSPGARLTLEKDLLARFPEGYRHLAYLQTKAGFDVKRDMPGARGPEIEALVERGRRWLADEPVDLRAPLT
jgi:hypothetical protein